MTRDAYLKVLETEFSSHSNKTTIIRNLLTKFDKDGSVETFGASSEELVDNSAVATEKAVDTGDVEKAGMVESDGLNKTEDLSTSEESTDDLEKAPQDGNVASQE